MPIQIHVNSGGISHFKLSMHMITQGNVPGEYPGF